MCKCVLVSESLAAILRSAPLLSLCWWAWGGGPSGKPAGGKLLTQMVTSMESIWSSWMRRMWNAGNCAFCGLPLQHEYFKKEIYSSLPQNATNWRSRWIKACNIGKKGCWFLLILSLVRTKTQVCPIGLLVKTPLGWIRSFVANPNYVVITRFFCTLFFEKYTLFSIF